MSMRTLVLTLLLGVGLASPALAQRLPATVTPEHYTLWFAPDLAAATFEGRATIDVRLEVPARTIVLHAAELTFDRVEVRSGDVAVTAVARPSPETETMTLTLPRELPAGPATIDISYTGVLNDQLRGFYLSRANGRRYAVSQMEATDARRAFPSFDEPAYKATFDISLTVAQGDSAISNGAVLSDTPGPGAGRHTFTFARTPRMSTYLVALLVGDFACRSGESDGTPIRVCATPDKLPLTAFALEAAEFQLAYFNRYFGIPYPFGKLDIIAVPDFSAGAMENAGAITFRERLLLAEPGRASEDVQKSIASVISHELAHQWFGNLVTMQWWNDLWLNEGFATWLASKPLAEWRPDWDVALDDATATQEAVALDALPSVRAIRTNVQTPAEIGEVFDGIAYEKSAAVLRMVEAFVGEEPFRRGVSSYLQRHAYGNAAAEDFWDEVSRVTRQPVDRIMRSYVAQPGVPVIDIETRCRADETVITVTQERFTPSASGTSAASATGGATWTFPVCLAQAGGAPQCHLVSQPRTEITVPGCAAEPFLNAGSSGYYLSAYAADDLRRLAGPALDARPATDRLALLADEWWMARSGRHDLGLFLDVADALADDASVDILQALSGRLGEVAGTLGGSPATPRYQAWLREHFAPALAALGPLRAGEDPDTLLRRAELIGLLGVTAGDGDVRQQARRLALDYLAQPDALPAALAPVVLRTAAIGADDALYERYRARLRTLGTEPETFYQFFNALPWFTSPAQVQATLALALSDEVRSQDASGLIGGLLAQPAARDMTWAFVQARWADISAKLDAFQGLPGVVSALGNFCTADAARDVTAFFAANPTPVAERALQQALERVEACRTFRTEQAGSAARWLDARAR